MKALLTRMYEHLMWANGVARDQVSAIAPDDPAAARAVQIYAHLAAAEHTWYWRILGHAPTVPIWPSLDMEAAAQLARVTGTHFLEYIRTMPADGQDTMVTYRNSRGQTFTNSVLDILTQVALHGSYHRGQLALLARSSGGSPAVTDYIAYVRDLESTAP